MSEQYLVSARKYRPQTFDTVVGQGHITTTLKNALKTHHLAHAYLFCGSRGVGKTTCARILAKTINCEHPTADMEACGQCASCKAFQENSSFNIFELDAASNNSVDDIRNLVDQVRFAPQQGKYKVYIIDEVHMLSQAAFNAFLKTLEEPPPYAIFILATTEKHKILPTILSRCQIFDFRRIRTEDIVNHLAAICEKEGVQAERAALHVIAQKAEGGMRDALSMMDRIAGFSNGMLTYAQALEHLNILDSEVYFRLLEMLLTKDIPAVMNLLDATLQKGFEGNLILNGFAGFLRDLLLSKDMQMAKLLDVPEDHKKRYFETAQLLPMPYLVSALNITDKSEQEYKSALNKRLHLEMAFIKLCYLQDLLNSSELKKKLINEERAHTPPIPKAPAVAIPTLSTEVPEAAPVRMDRSTPSPAAPLLASTPQSTPPATPVPPSPAPVIKAPMPTAGMGTARPKIGKDYLKMVHAKADELNASQKAVSLDMALAQQLFQEYKQAKRDNGLMTVVAQLEMVTVKVLPPNEICFVCTSSMSHTFAQGQRDEFLDFCSQKAHIQGLRVRTELNEIEAARQEAVKPKVLTKSELFDKMVAENPNLKKLRDALNLSIDY